MESGRAGNNGKKGSSWDFGEERDVSRFYIIIIGILSLFFLAYSLSMLRIETVNYATLTFFAAAAIILELVSIEAPSLGYSSLSLPLYLALIMISGNATVTTLVAFSAILSRTLILNRQPRWNRVFDFSSSLLGIMAMAFIYAWVNDASEILSGRNLVAVTLSVSAYTLIDYLTMASAKAMIDRSAQEKWIILRRRLRVMNFIIAPVGLISSATYLYSKESLWSLLLIIFPLAILRYAFQRAIRESKSEIDFEEIKGKLERNLKSERELNKLLRTDLKKKEDELTLYYEMNHQLGGSSSLEKTLDIVIAMVRRLIDSNSCVILTLNKGELEVCRAVSPYKDELELSSLLQLKEEIIIQVMKKREPLLVSEVMNSEDTARIFKDEKSLMCAPLIVKNELIGIIYIGAIKSGYYNVDHFHHLTSLANFVANAIFISQIHESEKSDKRRILAFFERYVSPEVVNEILKKSTEELGLKGERRRVTVMFLDIRRFTEVLETIAPSQILYQLNTLWAEMGEIIYSHGGTLLSYMGDALLAVFGAPIDRSDDAIRAVTAAVLMQERLVRLRERWERESRPLLHMGIGINTGEVIAGDMGFSKHREYTVLGETVNIAARLEKLNKEYSTSIIISESTYNEVHKSFSVNSLGLVTLRGISVPATIYEVRGINEAGVK